MTSEQSPQKFCSTCTHLIGKRDYKEDADKWKCGHEKNKDGVNLVTGIPVYKTPLVTLRNMEKDGDRFCSQEGLWWEEYKPYVPPMRELPSRGTSVKGVQAEDL